MDDQQPKPDDLTPDAQEAMRRWNACGSKVAYATAADAAVKGQASYRCRYCQKWHRTGRYGSAEGHRIARNAPTGLAAEIIVFIENVRQMRAAQEAAAASETGEFQVKAKKLAKKVDAQLGGLRKMIAIATRQRPAC